ncbi:MAG TPA: hypothetical protein VFL99_06655 [Segeticoccus sp.]|uniref:hypothetical protein n=1 Tax=Segeticoccus sp. TaxID=2706531 RepID=UPI002D7F111F|nr:hypothetical protein [Segeticoccus sp.]HET8599988.1 hypothetical protein [Segeticoccus sp.]
MVGRIGAGLLAGLVAGVALGLVARVFMRVVAVASATPTGFSVAGTLAICVAFVLAVLPGATVAACVRNRSRWVLPVLGALLLGAGALPELAQDLSGLSLFTTVRQVTAVAATTGVFVAIVLLPLATVRLVDRALRRAAPTACAS